VTVAPPRRTLSRRRLPLRDAAATAALAAIVAVALLVGTVSAALRLPGLAGLGRLGGSVLDYARGPAGEYFPLTDSFVDDALGLSPDEPNLAAAAPVLGPVGNAAIGPARTPAGPDDSVAAPDVVGEDLRNDDFGRAYAVRGLPFSAKSEGGNSREPGEPTSCADSGGTRWFQFTPKSDVDLTATTAGSDLSTAVAAFTGATLRTLRQVACDSDAAGDAIATFSAKRNTTYWFQVTQTVAGAALAFGLDLRGTTSPVSVVNKKAPPVISGNGRYVSFLSSDDLVAGAGEFCIVRVDNGESPDYPGAECSNVYVRDLHTGRTALVSTPDGRMGGNSQSGESAITPDGRFVAFYSAASNLVPRDTNENGDVFVRDLVAQRTTRVSLTSDEEETNDPGSTLLGPDSTDRVKVAISADGRFVAFSSSAPELLDLADDGACRSSNCVQVFVRDVVTGQTHLVSADPDGELYDNRAYPTGLSADGRTVAFTAGVYGQELVVASSWQQRRAQTASVSDSGDDVRGFCRSGQSLSADGRFLVFQSDAADVVAGDTNDAVDVFVRDLVARRTVRVSVHSSGAEAHPTAEQANPAVRVDSGYVSASISPDGRYVAFSSNAADLVAGDTNGNYDVFIHDLRRGTTTRVSVLDAGTQSSGASYEGSVSDSARSVVFITQAFTPQDDRAAATAYVRRRPV